MQKKGRSVTKTRIYELARDLELESKEVLARAQELGLEVKTASSGLDDDEAGLVRLSFQDDSADGPAAVPDDAEGTADESSSPDDAAADETPPALFTARPPACSASCTCAAAGRRVRS